MNINIQISQIVPDFFKKLKTKVFLSSMKIPQLDFYIKDKLSAIYPKVLDKYCNELNTILLEKMEFNRINFPIFFDNAAESLSDKIIKVNDVLYLAKDEVFSGKLICKLIKIEETSLFEINLSFDKYINLFDAHFYSSNNEQLTRVKINHIRDAIVDYFGYEQIIDFFTTTDWYKKYTELINQKELELELVIYNEWVKHNINLIKEL
jgi:hypothetical protein